MAKRSSNPKPPKSPCQIIENYEGAISAVSAGNKESSNLLVSFVKTMQPQFAQSHLIEARNIFLQLQWIKGKPTHFAEREVNKLIAHTESSVSSNYFQRKCRREMMDYGLMAAYKTIIKGSEDSEPARMHALVWLFDLVDHTTFEYHLIDPDLYYKHMMEIRHAVKGLIAEPSLREIIFDAASFSQALEALQPHIGSDIRKNKEALVFSPHAAVPDNLLEKYDTLHSLNTGLLTLGERLRDKKARQTTRTEHDPRSPEFINLTHKTIAAELRREAGECFGEGNVCVARLSRDAEVIAQTHPEEWVNAVESLSQGETMHPLIRRLKFQRYEGANRHIIEAKAAQVISRSERLNTPHLCQNAIYSLSELIHYWQAIFTHTSAQKSEHLPMDTRLPAYLLLLMVTGLDETRARTLKTGEGPTTPDDKTVYLSGEGRLRYNLEGSKASGQPDLQVELSCSQAFSGRLRSLLDKHSDGFTSVAALYADIKKVLRATHPDLPRYLSQWSHGAREILGTVLTDYEMDLVSGHLKYRNQIASAYVQTKVSALNQRVHESYTQFLSRLSPSVSSAMPWLSRCLDMPATRSEAKVGSTKPDTIADAQRFVDELYTFHRSLKKRMREAHNLHSTDFNAVVDNIQVLCINYWLMTQWLTTGRGHMERLEIIDAGYFLIAEDKDSARVRQPRICALTDTKHTWLSAWRNQYAIILKALNALKGLYPGLTTLDVDGFINHSPLVPLCLNVSDESFPPAVSVTTLSRSRLERIISSWPIQPIQFPSNLARHQWWSEMQPKYHPAWIRQQLGQQTQGIAFLSKSSAVSGTTWVNQMQPLSQLMDGLNLKVLTFGALPSLTGGSNVGL